MWQLFLKEGSDASDDLVSPFCDPCCPVYTASHLIMWRTKGKKLWNWATKSPCSRLDPGGFLLLEAIQVWAGPKDMVFNPFACEIGKRFPRFWKNRLNVKQDSVLLCLVPGLYLFYSILLLVYCLFIHLSMYLLFLFHSPFMNSGLGSEGNHIVTSHHHPNFPGVPPGAAWRVQW